MPYTPLWPTPPQLEDASGAPLSSGTLEFYIAGTTTPQNVYSDDTGTVLGTSVTLNSKGYPESGGNVVTVFRDTDVDMKVIAKDSGGDTEWTSDNIDQPTDAMFAGSDPDSIFAGTTIAAQLSEAKGIHKLKTAQEAKASDTTLADDSTLAGFTIEAGVWYLVEAIIFYSQNVGDFKFQFEHSNTPQLFVGQYSAQDNSGNEEGGSENFSANSVSITTTTDGEDVALRIIGSLQGHATLESTMDFQWAQDSSSANSTTVTGGSIIRVQKLQ